MGGESRSGRYFIKHNQARAVALASFISLAAFGRYSAHRATAYKHVPTADAHSADQSGVAGGRKLCCAVLSGVDHLAPIAPNSPEPFLSWPSTHEIRVPNCHAGPPRAHFLPAVPETSSGSIFLLDLSAATNFGRAPTEKSFHYRQLSTKPPTLRSYSVRHHFQRIFHSLISDS